MVNKTNVAIDKTSTNLYFVYAGKETVMSHIEKANELFANKFNCSQAVFAAFAEELGITEQQALKIGACFGSGMRQGEVCGACTGALMALGLKYGQCNEEDIAARLKTNEMTDKFLSEFKKESFKLCVSKASIQLSRPLQQRNKILSPAFTAILPVCV